jgi:transcriptional antiterminator NusG
LEARKAVAEERKEQELQDESDIRDDDRRWYVIHTYSGYENKVKQNLLHRIETMEMRDQIFNVIVPTEEEIEIKNGQRRTVQKKVFPGYVLVQMKMNDNSWYVVRNTPGVTSFVGHGNKPTPLEEEEVKAILKQMEQEAPKVKVSYQVGQAVKITDGPFTDFEGIVDAIDHERGRVRVLVSFFGREAPVELDFLQVTRLVE